MSAIAEGEYSGPDVKALRRIMAALFTAAVLCFAICLTLIVRAKPPQRQAEHITTPARCICGRQCLRHR
jgi:hypothetical protein